MIFITSVALVSLYKGDIHYTSPGGEFQLLGFAEDSKWDVIKTPESVSVDGDGHPAKILVHSSGISISSNAIAANAVKSTPASKIEKEYYFLTQSHTRGDTVFVMDTGEADGFKAQAALKSGKKFVPPLSTNRTELDTDRSDYVGTQTEGSLSLPTPFSVKNEGSGTREVLKDSKKVLHSFVQHFVMQGVSGTMKVDPRPNAGIHALTSGEFLGPIQIQSDRTETDLSDKTESKFTLSGHCDKIRIESNASGETVTAEGNVDFELWNDGQALHLSGKSVVFKFDLNLALTEAHGNSDRPSPFTTTIPLKSKKQ
jgi:hypothetical protein